MAQPARGVVLLLVLGVAIGAWMVLRERPFVPRIPDESPELPPAGAASLEARSATRILPAAFVDLQPVEGAASREGPELRVRFVAPDGSLVPTAEARRRFEGQTVLAELVSDDELTKGDVRQYFDALTGDPRRWRQSTSLAWDDQGAKIGVRLAPGRWRLFLTRPGATPCISAPVSADEPHPVADVVLRAEPRLKRVRFVEADTLRPLARAEVVPWAELGDDQAFVPGIAVRTDDAGEVDLPVHDTKRESNERPPTWWIETPTHLGGLPGWRLDGEGVLEERVSPRAAVFGTAWLRSGAVAKGRRVASMSKGRVQSATVADDGSYRIEPVLWVGEPHGTIVLIEDQEAGHFVTASFDPKPGAAVRVDLGSPGSAVVALQGRITAGAEPLAGVWVWVQSADRSTRVVATGADGKYVIEAVTPGDATVAAILGDGRAIDDYTIRSLAPIRLGPESRPVDFALPAGVIEVTVVDDQSGKPVPRGVGFATPEPPHECPPRFPGFRWTAGWGGFTDRAGVALLRALPEEVPHAVSGAAEGYAETSVKGIVPGTKARPAQVTIRVQKKR